MQIFSNKIKRDYDMILKLSWWKQNLLFRRGQVQKKILVVEKNMNEVFFCIRELRQQIMKYFDFSLENAFLDHMVHFVFSDGAV